MYLTICNAEGRAVSLQGDECLESCGDFGTNVSGECQCISGAVINIASSDSGKKETLTCIASEACTGYLVSDGGVKYCVTKEYCQQRWFTYEDRDAKLCVDS